MKTYAIRHKINWRHLIFYSLFWALIAAFAGCTTIQSDFNETIYEYDDAGEVASRVVTEWQQAGKGAPFTNIEKMKQDSQYRIEEITPDGTREILNIAQGSGVEGVDASGQVAAFQMGMASLFGMIDKLSQLFAPQPAPSDPRAVTTLLENPETVRALIEALRGLLRAGQ